MGYTDLSTPPLQTEYGYGANFKDIFAEYRHIPWLNGGYTKFQFVILGAIPVALAGGLTLVGYVVSLKSVYAGATFYIVAPASFVLGMFFSAKLAISVDKTKRHGNTQAQYLWDILRYRFAPRHIVNGKPYYTRLHRRRSNLNAQTTKKVVRNEGLQSIRKKREFS